MYEYIVCVTYQFVSTLGVELAWPQEDNEEIIVVSEVDGDVVLEQLSQLGEALLYHFGCFSQLPLGDLFGFFGYGARVQTERRLRHLKHESCISTLDCDMGKINSIFLGVPLVLT